MLVIKIIGVIICAGLIGAYIQVGLFLTASGSPIWWMIGLGQWLAWVAIPIAITTVVIYK